MKFADLLNAVLKVRPTAAGPGGPARTSEVAPGPAPTGRDDGGRPVGGEKAPERPGGLHGAPCRLKLRYPPEETGSWFGGRPDMPSDVPWPKASDGAPMVFYAQIALKDVPRATWGGLHPPDGWLAIFRGSDGSDEACAVHVPKLGHTRERGPGEHGYFLPPGFAMLAAKVWPGKGTFFGHDLRELPRWPVTIEPAAPGDRIESAPMVTHVFPEANLADPAWMPFDRLGQIFFLLVAREVLDWERSNAGRRGPKDDAAPDAGLDETIAALGSRVAEIDDALAEALSDVGGARSAQLDGVIRAQLATPYRGMRKDGITECELSTSLKSRYDLVEAHEFCARRAMLERPGTLPDAVHALFDDFWRSGAEVETALLGGEPSLAMKEHDHGGAKLLELPSSYLVGWHFGDLSEASFALDADDLARGGWDRARYFDTHGL